MTTKLTSNAHTVANYWTQCLNLQWWSQCSVAHFWYVLFILCFLDYVCKDFWGRHSYSKQMEDCRWCCEMLAAALDPLVAKSKTKDRLHLYDEAFHNTYLEIMRSKVLAVLKYNLQLMVFSKRINKTIDGSTPASTDSSLKDNDVLCNLYLPLLSQLTRPKQCFCR